LMQVRTLCATHSVKGALDVDVEVVFVVVTPALVAAVVD